MKRFLLSILCCLLSVVSGYAEDVTATLSFADKAQRTDISTSKQVWEKDGITFTNNKSKSTSNVADYANPVRLYASSEIVVECSLGNITKIVFDCNSPSYATALKNSIGSTATTSVSSDKVTVSLNGSGNSFTIAKLTAQVRMDALTVTNVKKSEGEVSAPVTPQISAEEKFVGSTLVKITCDTEDAKIYYTTDGNTPTKSSILYTEPFTIYTTTTVKAIAINDGGESNVTTATYTRVAATPNIDFGGDANFKSSIEVKISPAEGTTAYYTLNGKEPNEDSNECPKTLTLKADATLQVVAYDTEGYASSIVKQEFKLQSSDESGGAAGTATLVTDVTELAVDDQVIIVASNSNAALSTNQKSNNRDQVAITKDGNDVELVDGVQILTLKAGTAENSFAFFTGSGYLYAASSSKNYLKTQTLNNTNGSWDITIDAKGVATIKAKGSNTHNWLRYNSSDKLFSCYSSDQADVSLYKVNTASYEDYVLNVTKAGWATLYLGYAVTIPAEVKCYVISRIEGETVVLEQVEGTLPANTGVIVEALEGEYTFVPTKETATVSSNLDGTIKNEYITKEAYVLGLDENDKVGLYKAVMAGGVFLNNANKAYLPASEVPEAVQGANGFKFRFETTGIEGVSAVKGEKVIFDLAGRKLNDMSAPGIYIVNGKKVMVK